jgi:hypothetical protein
MTEKLCVKISGAMSFFPAGKIGTIPSAFECLDVLVHAKSLVWECDVIDDLIGDCAERTLNTASALMAFTNLGRAREGHSLRMGREAG